MGFCEDGGTGGEDWSVCDLGSDCIDCGPRVQWNTANVKSDEFSIELTAFNGIIIRDSEDQYVFDDSSSLATSAACSDVDRPQKHACWPWTVIPVHESTYEYTEKGFHCQGDDTKPTRSPYDAHQAPLPH